MTKGIKRSMLLKIGSSHLHLLYYQRVYMVVTNSQTLRPSHCLNGNWVIRSGSSAWVILHLPVILLLSFDGKLMTKGLKTCKAKLWNWGLLDMHICFGFFLTCYLYSNLLGDLIKIYLFWSLNICFISSPKEKSSFHICMIVILDVTNSELPIGIFFRKQSSSRLVEGVYTSLQLNKIFQIKIEFCAMMAEDSLAISALDVSKWVCV